MNKEYYKKNITEYLGIDLNQPDRVDGVNIWFRVNIYELEMYGKTFLISPSQLRSYINAGSYKEAYETNKKMI